MFLCLLPVDVGAALADTAPTQSQQVMHTDAGEVPMHCMEITEQGTDLSCKSEASGSLVNSDLVKVVAIANGALHRIVELIPFRAPVGLAPVDIPARSVHLYLFLCTFLK